MINYLQYLNLPKTVTVIVIIVLVISGLTSPTKNLFKEFSTIIRKTLEAFNEKKAIKESLKINQEAIRELSKKQDEDRRKSKQGDRELRQEVEKIKNSVDKCMDFTLHTRIEGMRNTILDFASALANGREYLREQFNFVIKVHNEYEELIEKNNLTNDEVEISFKIIMEIYEQNVRNNSFLDDKIKSQQESGDTDV